MNCAWVIYQKAQSELDNGDAEPTPDLSKVTTSKLKVLWSFYVSYSVLILNGRHGNIVYVLVDMPRLLRFCCVKLRLFVFELAVVQQIRIDYGSLGYESSWGVWEVASWSYACAFSQWCKSSTQLCLCMFVAGRCWPMSLKDDDWRRS